MSLGSDLKNQSDILKKKLEKIAYPFPLTFKIFQEENPLIFLQILHHAVIIYSNEYYLAMIAKGYELFSKSDLKFVESLYKFLQMEHGFKPSISIKNFLSNGFLEQKLILANTVIDLILKSAPQPKKNGLRMKTPKDRLNEENKSQDNDIFQHENIQQNLPQMEEYPLRDVELIKKAEFEKIIPQQISKIKEIKEVFGEEKERINREAERMNSKVEDMQNKNNQLNRSSNQDLVYQNNQREESYGIQGKTQGSSSKLERAVTVREFNEMMQLIVSLNQTIQLTVQKFDTFDSAITNLNAKYSILEGEVKLIRAQQESDNKR